MPSLLLALLVVAPPAAPAIPSAAVDGLRALAVATADDPPIETVQAAAARVALGGGGDPASVPGRARWSALLPRVTAEIRHLEQSNRTVGLASSGEVDYLRLTPGTTVALRATWDLPELVAPRGELAAARAAAEAARRQTDAALRATALHFERRRRRVALLLAPPEDARGRAEAELELARLTAELDALTGGLYTGAAR